MARKKKQQPEEEVEYICYLCDTFSSLHILRREGSTSEMAKECNGKTIIGKHLACQDFQVTKYFWCDNADHRISIETCNRRRTQPYSECSKICVMGGMVKKIIAEMKDKGKIIKRMEIENGNGSLFSSGNESESRRIDLEPNLVGSSRHQKRERSKESLGNIITRIFS